MRRYSECEARVGAVRERPRSGYLDVVSQRRRPGDGNLLEEQEYGGSSRRTTTRAKVSLILENLHAAISGAGRVVRYPAGAALMIEGEPATRVHPIVSGAVKLVSASPSGRDVTVGMHCRLATMGAHTRCG